MTAAGGADMMRLDSTSCWTLLRASEVGRLAVSVADHPDIFPVNYVVDRGTIVFRTAEGTKLAGSIARPAVAFEVDGYDLAAARAWSVVVKGRAEQIRHMEELIDTTDLPLFPWHAAPKQRFVRIVPDQVTGRRFPIVDHAAWSAALWAGASAPKE